MTEVIDDPLAIEAMRWSMWERAARFYLATGIKQAANMTLANWRVQTGSTATRWAQVQREAHERREAAEARLIECKTAWQLCMVLYAAGGCYVSQA